MKHFKVTLLFTTLMNEQSKLLLLIAMFMSMVGAKSYAEVILYDYGMEFQAEGYTYKFIYEGYDSYYYDLYGAYEWIDGYPSSSDIEIVRVDESWSGMIPSEIKTTFTIWIMSSDWETGEDTSHEEEWEITLTVKRIGDDVFSGKGITSLTIPSSITSIGNHAFANCGGLTSLTIPNNVTNIGEGAFAGCNALTSITVQNGNPTYDSRNNCNAIINTSSNILITGCKNSIIPSTVTGIGNSAFSGCTGLSSLSIPNSVKRIGGGAFSGCTGLTSLTIPNSVTIIDEGAFSGCNGLTSVIIPTGIKTINEGLFSNCRGLASVVIPSSVTSIYRNSFYDCQNLTTIDIPSSVTTIDEHAFGDSGLTSLVVPSSVTTIGDYAFSGCKSLSSITMANSVTAIGEGAFSSTEWLNKQPDGIVYVGKVAYGYKGNKPTDIVIEEGTLGIAGGAFNYSELTSVAIPNSVVSIGKDAFHWGSEWYKNLPDGLVYLGKVAYRYIGTMPDNASIEIEGGTVSISADAFFGQSGLTSIIIPNSVKSIGREAFSYCRNLCKVNIPQNVTNIGEWAFNNCSNLVQVILPNGLESIRYGLFYDCRKLESVTIPESINRIENDVFSGCRALSYVISKPAEPISVSMYNSDNHKNCVLYVPLGSKAAYESATYWKEFKEIIEMEPDEPGQIEPTDISQLDNAIYIEPVEGLVGSTVDLCVKLKNTLTPVGCSFMLTLPNGLRLLKDEDGDVVYQLGSRAKKMSVTMQDRNDGSYNFSLTPSTSTATITGNEGTFITFHLQVPADAVADQAYPIKLTNNLLQTSEDGTLKDNKLSDVLTTLFVYDYMPGDVNGDKSVTPSDAIMILYHYFGVEQSGFIVKAADLNGDGNISPADAIAALYLYFGTVNASRPAAATQEPQ